MPNHVETRLDIAFPSAAARAACLAELEGPADWAMPLCLYHEHEITSVFCRGRTLSRHAQRRLEARSADLAASLRAFRAEHAPHCPDWMPISRECLRVFMLNPDTFQEAIVPLSLPRLLPYADRTEFDALLPGRADESGLWAKADDSAKDPISVRSAKIGVKWPPYRVALTDTSDGAFHGAMIRFESPWSPIENLAGILQPIFARHDAICLATWLEEQGFGEIEAITPQGAWVIEDFDLEDYPQPDEDDPECIHLDEAALRERASDLFDALIAGETTA